jgi:hypothetical protein
MGYAMSEHETTPAMIGRNSLTRRQCRTLEDTLEGMRAEVESGGFTFQAAADALAGTLGHRVTVGNVRGAAEAIGLAFPTRGKDRETGAIEDRVRDLERACKAITDNVVQGLNNATARFDAIESDLERVWVAVGELAAAARLDPGLFPNAAQAAAQASGTPGDESRPAEGDPAA